MALVVPPTAKATFRAWKDDGDLFFEKTVGPRTGAWPTYDNAMTEGKTVTIQVCVLGGRGCATQSNLRT